MEKLNPTFAEGYPSRNTETAGLLRDQFVKPPRSSRWYNMHADKKDSDRSTVRSWSLVSAKLNNRFSRVARHSLPAAPHSRALSQDILRLWERAAREQYVMCNQAAGLSRCLTRVQDAMSTQLKNLHSDTGKGKSTERMQQAVDETGVFGDFQPVNLPSHGQDNAALVWGRFYQRGKLHPCM